MEVMPSRTTANVVAPTSSQATVRGVRGSQKRDDHPYQHAAKGHQWMKHERENNERKCVRQTTTYHSLAGKQDQGGGNEARCHERFIHSKDDSATKPDGPGGNEE